MDGQLVASPCCAPSDISHTFEHGFHAYAVAGLYRSGEARFVDTVIHHHAGVFHHDDLGKQDRRQGEREMTMRDGLAVKGGLSCSALGIYMNPLVIPGDFRESVDLTLRHEMPLGETERLSDVVFQRLDVGNGDGWHSEIRSPDSGDECGRGNEEEDLNTFGLNHPCRS